MWIVGDWGQSGPWQRTSGVKMTKGENGVYTGVLALPKGSKFDIKILKSTVSTTSGGNNVWSAVRYSSVLNASASHDFGEFADNLIPNGNFDEGLAKWTVNGKCLANNIFFQTPPNSLLISDSSSYVTSDSFVLPANQVMRLTGYVYNNVGSTATGDVVLEVVDGDGVISQFTQKVNDAAQWTQFSKTFTTGDTARNAAVTLKVITGTGIRFDTLSLVSP